MHFMQGSYDLTLICGQAKGLKRSFLNLEEFELTKLLVTCLVHLPGQNKSSTYNTVLTGACFF